VRHLSRRRPQLLPAFPYTTLFRSLWNSGISSRNNTPLCARLISPGRGHAPPPTTAEVDAVWWGARNGGRRGAAVSLPARPCKARSEEHTSELQSRENLVCRLLLEK